MWQMSITWISSSGITMTTRLCHSLQRMRWWAVHDNAMAMSSVTCTGTIEWLLLFLYVSGLHIM